MSRLSNPGCALRASSALMGTIFLPTGVAFLIVNLRRYWPEGIGILVASAFFFTLAVRAYDIVGIAAVPDAPDEPPGAPPSDL